MKLDALLMLQRSDIAHFVRDPAAYAGLKLIFIDPGTVDEAVNQGVDSARFDYRPLDVGRHLQARVTAEAMNRAQALDRLLYRERVKLFGQGEFQGWECRRHEGRCRCVLATLGRLYFILGCLCDNPA